MDNPRSSASPLQGVCTLGSRTGRWVLSATLLASAASFMLWSAVAVALPSIQNYFAATISGIQWVVNAYLLMLAALLLIGGSLGDHHGRKRMFIIGMAVFVAGAALASISWSLDALIAFEGLQGIGSALMVPQSLAIINACFPREERGRAIGLWAGISGGIAALGPWVGGWLVETFGWQSIFWMPVPVIALAIVVTARFIPENQTMETGKLDWPGTFFVFLGLLGIAYGLIGGPSAGWNAPLVVASLGGGVVALGIFVAIEMRSASPLVPLVIFQNPLVSGANAVTVLLYFAFNGVILFVVLNLQQIQGFTPTEAGLRMLPPVVVITLLAGPAGTLADRIGPRPQMIAAPAIVALGIVLLMLGDQGTDYLTHFMPGLIATGIGMSLVIAPLTKSALSVETRYSGAASGVNNAIARTAGLLAVAVLGAVMLAAFVPRLADTLQASALSAEEQHEIMAQYDKLGGIIIPDDYGQAAQAAARNAIQTSFIYAFRWAMGVCAVLALLASVVSFFTIHKENESSIRSGDGAP